MVYAETAAQGLKSYGLEAAQLTRLGGADNVNFRVDKDNKSYVLRLRKSARHTRASVASELALLSSLRATLVLPKPVKNLAGEYVTSIAADGIETLCTLMTWIEGHIPPTADALSDEHLLNVGALMAHLHVHSQSFRPPEGFTRETFDETYFRKRLETLYHALNGADVSSSELLKRDAQKIVTHFAQLSRDKSSFGLIHADFHSGNYLLDGAQVHIIDFDRCGFGFYLFDLALALMELRAEQRLVFLQGYENVRSLPSDFANLNALFLSLAYLDNLGFLAANPEELPFIVGELPFVTKAFRKAAEVVAHDL